MSKLLEVRKVFFDKYDGTRWFNPPCVIRVHDEERARLLIERNIATKISVDSRVDTITDLDSEIKAVEEIKEDKKNKPRDRKEK